MMTCYLLGCVDTKTGKFLGASIFSESAPTTTGPRFYFVIWETHGVDYEHARDQMLLELRANAKLKWARKLI